MVREGFGWYDGVGYSPVKCGKFKGGVNYENNVFRDHF